MRRLSKISAIAVYLLSPINAHSETAPAGTFFSVGVGGSLCDDFNRAKEYNDSIRRPSDPPNSYRDAAYSAMLSWVQGFVRV
jgi:hypothetical protein